MRLTSNIVIALLITIQAGFVIAETIDDSPEVVSLYARGKRLMREGKFLDAKLFLIISDFLNYSFWTLPPELITKDGFGTVTALCHRGHRHDSNSLSGTHHSSLH